MEQKNQTPAPQSITHEIGNDKFSGKDVKNTRISIDEAKEIAEGLNKVGRDLGRLTEANFLDNVR